MRFDYMLRVVSDIEKASDYLGWEFCSRLSKKECHLQFRMVNFCIRDRLQYIAIDLAGNLSRTLSSEVFFILWLVDLQYVGGGLLTIAIDHDDLSRQAHHQRDKGHRV
jgi:hypothetical protein